MPNDVSASTTAIPSHTVAGDTTRRATTCMRYSDAKPSVSPVHAVVESSTTSYQIGAAVQSRSSWKSVIRYGAFGKNRSHAIAPAHITQRAAPRRDASYTTIASTRGTHASVRFQIRFAYVDSPV